MADDLPRGRSAIAPSCLYTPDSTRPPACRIEILTPLRVKRDGRHVGPQDFRFADFFGPLLRRISMLTAFHTDTPLETDFRGLMEAARQTTAVCQLTWQDLTRYSSRQKTTMKLGGVLGRIDLVNDDLAPFWPYLWLGRFVHAGSGATMGLGRYEIYPTSLQAEPPRLA
jgi:CRISPR/Cas system endoribonuclease Cas6 (RAMP superfamily)